MARGLLCNVLQVAGASLALPLSIAIVGVAAVFAVVSVIVVKRRRARQPISLFKTPASLFKTPERRSRPKSNAERCARLHGDSYSPSRSETGSQVSRACEHDILGDNGL
jgi:hypothetical protein